MSLAQKPAIYGWGANAYWLGMKYPNCFIAFGIVLIAPVLLLQPLLARRGLDRFMLAMGLQYFYYLCLLSFFGNYGDLNSWYRVCQIRLFH